MPTKQGTDIRALTDIEDPEQYSSGEENVALSQARRLLQPEGTNEKVGDPLQNDTINVREWLGSRPSAQQLDVREAEVVDVLTQDDRVAAVDVSVEFTNSAIEIAFSETVNGRENDLVLSIDKVTGAKLVSEG